MLHEHVLSETHLPLPQPRSHTAGSIEKARMTKTKRGQICELKTKTLAPPKASNEASVVALASSEKILDDRR
jgi:hypothetical protein